MKGTIGASVLVIALSAFSVCAKRSGAESLKRGVTIADSIGMTRIGDPSFEYSDSSVAVFSPDKKRFVVITRKGDLSNDTNKYSLLLFQSETVFKDPKPVVLLTMASSSNRAGIQAVRWMRDNATLTFLGVKDGSQQIYALNTHDGQLRQLTKHLITS